MLVATFFTLLFDLSSNKINQPKFLSAFPNIVV